MERVEDRYVCRAWVNPPRSVTLEVAANEVGAADVLAWVAGLGPVGAVRFTGKEHHDIGLAESLADAGLVLSHHRRIGPEPLASGLPALVGDVAVRLELRGVGWLVCHLTVPGLDTTFHGSNVSGLLGDKSSGDPWADTLDALAGALTGTGPTTAYWPTEPGATVLVVDAPLRRLTVGRLEHDDETRGQDTTVALDVRELAEAFGGATGSLLSGHDPLDVLARWPSTGRIDSLTRLREALASKPPGSR